MTSRGLLEYWHRMIGDRTFGDTMLDRLAHRFTTGGSSHHLRSPEFPTDYPPPSATLHG
jgi:hypothetical protein